LSTATPLTLSATEAQGCVLVGAGSYIITTVLTPVRQSLEQMIFGVLVGTNHAGL
jgi:hypothetical protein